MPTGNAQPAQPTQRVVQPTSQPESSAEPPVLQQKPPVSIWLDAAVPDGLRAALKLDSDMRILASRKNGAISLTALAAGETAPLETNWVYALVAPFPTVMDGVSTAELRQVWQGKAPKLMNGSPLMMSASTRAALEIAWGIPAANAVRILAADEILETAWAEQPTWAIVPFEELSPRWKVLTIGGNSPLQKDLALSDYPLTLRFGLIGETGLAELPVNWQPEKMTTLTMTGVTAMVRKFAERMESHGETYPAEEIGKLLRSTDLTHISNEVSFTEDCPAPERRDPNFCSPPKYVRLLEAVGTDIVELTGNHVLDRGDQAFLNTLEIYAGNGWRVFGGGINAAAARSALLLEDHGNRLAFIGCNAAGPESVWASEDNPGAAKCDFGWLVDEIARLKKQGYLVIATMQHVEVCQMPPHLAQQADSGKLLDAGADVVIGSQAHCPQALFLKGDQVVHYGLGNLFFDQMDAVTRRQFIDQFFVYDGKLMSIQLVTTMLEDYARPRLMIPTEREKLLEDVFRASGWIK